ncbi:MAG: DNA-binding protein WhiA [Ruminococcus sp.]|nr:DNA-binding protein WhiA [Ruminococcus sp.]
MSFSNEVRKEICSAITDKDRRFACLYGMLLYCRHLSPERISFQSKSKTAADAFAELFRRVFHQELTCRLSESASGKTLYIYDITEPALIGDIFAKYRFTDGVRSFDEELVSTSSLGVFTAGVFLSCGSVNDPEKEYHLEFSVPCENLALELVSLLGDIGVTARTTKRRGQTVVYIKGSESIEDTLTFIGAQQCTLELMNVKIYKDVRNKANRIANCDSANIDKVVAAAMKQQEDIRLIAGTIGLDSLSEELREVAELRLESSGMSLSEIGAALSEPISRSGDNHHFKKLARIADEIRNGGSREK